MFRRGREGEIKTSFLFCHQWPTVHQTSPSKGMTSPPVCLPFIWVAESISIRTKRNLTTSSCVQEVSQFAEDENVQVWVWKRLLCSSLTAPKSCCFHSELEWWMMTKDITNVTCRVQPLNCCQYQGTGVRLTAPHPRREGNHQKAGF